MPVDFTIYYLERDLDGNPIILIRKGSKLERLDPDGWTPTANLEWTGIGGSADWDIVDEEEALKAALVLGNTAHQFQAGRSWRML